MSAPALEAIADGKLCEFCRHASGTPFLFTIEDERTGKIETRTMFLCVTCGIDTQHMCTGKGLQYLQEYETGRKVKTTRTVHGVHTVIIDGGKHIRKRIEQNKKT